VTDEEIEKILANAARVPHELPEQLLARIAESIKPTLQPVQPLPATPVLASRLILIGAAVAVAGAALTGFHGIRALAPLAGIIILTTLLVLGYLAAEAFVDAMVPGSRHRLSALTLVAVVSTALLVVFALLFRDYRVDHFVRAGAACLLVGLLFAVPSSFFGWLLMRRGVATHGVSAGIAGGALAGLAGVAMLELHCANFEAPHVLLWHTAVVPVSAAGGALLGWLSRRNARARASPVNSIAP
jgi:hypothetical protein